jgi:hypothetical protein
MNEQLVDVFFLKLEGESGVGICKRDLSAPDVTQESFNSRALGAIQHNLDPFADSHAAWDLGLQRCRGDDQQSP